MASNEIDVTKEETKVEDLSIDESQHDQVKGGLCSPGKLTFPNLKVTMSLEF